MNQLDIFAQHLARDGQRHEGMIRIILDQENPHPDGIAGNLEFLAALDFFFFMLIIPMLDEIQGTEGFDLPTQNVMDEPNETLTAK